MIDATRPGRTSSAGMAKVTTALSVSVDGFIAGPGDGDDRPLGIGGDALFRWMSAGETPSGFHPSFRMSAASARFFDDGARACGAVVTGRRTYDIAHGWGGDGPLPGVPVVVLAHAVPAEAPAGSATCTFVTEGIEAAVGLAREAAGPRDVDLMGSAAVRQALAVDLLDELVLHVVPVLLGDGVRLLDGVPRPLECLEVVPAPGVTHVRYRVLH